VAWAGNSFLDKRRDAFLMAKGYRVLRFNNNDVIANRYGVLTLIAEVLESAPSLPSPAGGGGYPSKWGVVRYTAWSAEERR
jgi:hypothetical protein